MFGTAGSWKRQFGLSGAGVRALTLGAVLESALPLGTRRRRLASSIYRRLPWRFQYGVISYQDWVRYIEPHSLAPVTKYTYEPLISIIVPVHQTPPRYLREMIASVTEQTYENWELCVVVAGSLGSESTGILRQSAAHDQRVRLVELEANQGIAGNTNAGLAQAKGEFVAFLDHDDTVAPFALNEVAASLNRDASTGIFYSDEDKLTDDGLYRDLPYFKPDWSIDLFMTVNYLAHFVVARTDLVRLVGGLRSACDGAQDYDLLLRMLHLGPRITHIPHVSYHWRMAADSTARRIDAKAYADSSGRRALEEYLGTEGIPAQVEPIPKKPTNYRVRYTPAVSPKVSIIIPFKDKVELLEDLLPGIRRSTYKHVEVILVSNLSIERRTEVFLERVDGEPDVKTLRFDKPFNYSEANNVGRRAASGELLLFLNNDIVVREADWLDELVGVATQPGVGAVGPLLLYPDDTIQHAGIVMGMTGLAGHVFRHLLPDELTYYGLASWPRTVTAVTGACLMVQSGIFDKVGGFDEAFTLCGSDVALCLRIHEAGYRNVYWPFARLTHLESKTVVSYDRAPRSDYFQSLKYYRPYVNHRDPFYNVNLDHSTERIAPRREWISHSG